MTQQEFDYQMKLWSGEQGAASRPILDAQMEINRKRLEIKAEIATLNARFNLLGAQWHELEQKRKDINRRYHEIKHQFVLEHPKEETQRDSELARHAGEQAKADADAQEIDNK